MFRKLIVSLVALTGVCSSEEAPLSELEIYRKEIGWVKHDGVCEIGKKTLWTMKNQYLEHLKELDGKPITIEDCKERCI